MRSPGRDLAAHERGFMLVGVVTFMLALTILGLSLFALSSYEAQFFTVSASREQSLQNAEGGMELVKALLQKSPQRLENAQLAVGQRGVTRAMAYQWRSSAMDDTTSWGPVNWDSTVVLVVTASSGGVERTLEARFIPTPSESPYKRLLTSSLGIRCNTDNGTSPSVLDLRGRVWQYADSWADTSWTELLTWSTGRPMLDTRPPVPLADAFVDDHLPAATSEPTYWSGGSGPYQMALSNYGSGPKFFHSPPSADDPEHPRDEHDWYSFFVHDELTIRIRGKVVWVVPEGACFYRHVRIMLDDDDVPGTLILVAKANRRQPGHEDRGIWFQGGLSVYEQGARVYLVSEGGIALTRERNKFESDTAERISIVAGGEIELGGPSSGYWQRLAYGSASMHAHTDELISDLALPKLSSGTSMAFVIARSSWGETTPR